MIFSAINSLDMSNNRGLSSYRALGQNRVAYIVEVGRGQKKKNGFSYCRFLLKNTGQKCPCLGIEWPHNPDGHYALDRRNSHTASSAFTWATTDSPRDPQRLLLVFCVINTTVSANFWTMSIATTGGNIVIKAG